MTCDEPDAKIDYVVVGLDRDFHYRKLARAQRAILAGARVYSHQRGRHVPDGGRRATARRRMHGGGVRIATNTEPFVIGKPIDLCV